MSKIARRCTVTEAVTTILRAIAADRRILRERPYTDRGIALAWPVHYIGSS